MPIKDYICTTPECPENTGHYPDSHRVIELFVGINEEPDCKVCGFKLTQVIDGAPRGYVRGTTNYCRN